MRITFKLPLVGIFLSCFIAGHAVAAEDSFTCQMSAYAYEQNFDETFTTENSFYSGTQGDVFTFDSEADYADPASKTLLYRRILDTRHAIAFDYYAIVMMYNQKPYMLLTSSITDYSDANDIHTTFSRDFLDLKTGAASTEVHFNSADPKDNTKAFVRASFFDCQKTN